MHKKTLRLVFISFLILSLLSGINHRKPVSGAVENVWIPASNGAVEGDPQVEVKTISETSLQVQIRFSGVWAKPVSNDYGDFTALFFEGYGERGILGAPNLPIYTTQIEIPQGVTPQVKIITSQSKPVQLSAFLLPETVLPTQPLTSKSGPEPQWQPPDAQIYGQNTIYPQQNFTAIDPYQIRDHHILPLQINPVRYQPQNRTLEILEIITLQIDWESSSVQDRSAQRMSSAAFDSLAKSLVINPQTTDQEINTQTEVGYLIISPAEFNDILAPLVTLKTNQGYQVTLVNLGTTGSSTQLIKQYLENAYNNWPVPPSYLLLVGDTNYIPAWYPYETPNCVSGDYCFDKATDLYYGTITADYVPDIFVGRLPARSQAQLTTLVNKLLAYEAASGIEEWVSKAAFAATADTNLSSSMYTYNYQLAEASHNYVISNYTAPLGYTGIFPAPAPVAGGDKLYRITYSAFESDLKASMNEGRGMIIYSGHGSKTGWSDFSLYTIDFSDGSLTTNEIYPFVAAFACETNDITYEQVFGETWMLTQDKGSVAYLGSADYSYWGPDDILERSLFDALFENTFEKPGLSQAIVDGLTAVQTQYPEFARYYWETYMLLGDPSLKIKSPSFSLSLDTTVIGVCVGGTSQSYPLTANAFYGFNEDITLTSSVMPTGVSLTFADNPILPDAVTEVMVTADPSAQVALLPVTLYGTGSTSSASTSATLLVSNQSPLSPIQISPKNKTVDTLFPTLSWWAVDQTKAYQLQIAADADFTQIIAEVDDIPESSYTLPSALESSTTYYWRVRAKNACGSSSYLSVAQFRTPTVNGDCLITSATQTEYLTDFENVSADWSSISGLNNNYWLRQEVRSQSPTNAYFSKSAETPSLQHLESPDIYIPTDTVNPTLRFWQWYDIQKSSDVATCDDGGLIQYSTNGGSEWEYFTAEQLLTTSYTGEITGLSNPLSSQFAWCGTSSGWVKTVVDLSALQGETIKIRFSQATDVSVANEGWYIDDVKVQTCTPLETIFLPLISD